MNSIASNIISAFNSKNNTEKLRIISNFNYNENKDLYALLPETYFNIFLKFIINNVEHSKKMLDILTDTYIYKNISIDEQNIYLYKSDLDKDKIISHFSFDDKNNYLGFLDFINKNPDLVPKFLKLLNSDVIKYGISLIEVKKFFNKSIKERDILISNFNFDECKTNYVGIEVCYYNKFLTFIEENTENYENFIKLNR